MTYKHITNNNIKQILLLLFFNVPSGHNLLLLFY
jgi:hypothetical protein